MTTPNLDRHPAWKLQTDLHAQETTAAELRGVILNLGRQLNWFHGEIARLKDLDTPKCLYCWVDVPTREAAREHMEVCDKHPMAAIRKEHDMAVLTYELQRAEVAAEMGLMSGEPGKRPAHITMVTQARTLRRAAAQAGVEQSHLYKMIAGALPTTWKDRPGTLAERMVATITGLRQLPSCHRMEAMPRLSAPARAPADRQNETAEPGHNVTPSPVGQAGGDFEQPTMNCPKCQKEYQDFDGVGVVYCQPAAGCGFCRHMARTGEKCDYCGDVRSEGEPLRDGLPPGALRAAHAEWNVESDMNNQSLVATCTFSLHGTECSISTWGQPHSPMPVAAFRRWDEVRFKPIGKSWSEVETLAARHLGAEDSKAGRERRSMGDLMVDLFAASIQPAAKEQLALNAAYNSAYDDGVDWWLPGDVTADQELALRKLGGNWDRPDTYNTRPTVNGRPIPWSMLEGK